MELAEECRVHNTAKATADAPTATEKAAKTAQLGSSTAAAISVSMGATVINVGTTA